MASCRRCRRRCISRWRWSPSAKAGQATILDHKAEALGTAKEVEPGGTSPSNAVASQATASCFPECDSVRLAQFRAHRYFSRIRLAQFFCTRNEILGRCQGLLKIVSASAVYRNVTAMIEQLDPEDESIGYRWRLDEPDFICTISHQGHGFRIMLIFWNNQQHDVSLSQTRFKSHFSQRRFNN